MLPSISPFRISFIFLAILVCVPSALAQKPTPTPERNREIVALLNDARLAAPELAVDTFLKVVESKKVTDPVWRKEIIEEALRMIDDVQYPMPMHAAFGGDRDGTIRSLNDTEAYILISAYSAKLDKLSFKGRAIMLLLETDRERAKRLIFQMGGQLGLKPRTCEDVLSYTPDDIYLVVGKVAKALFTVQQVAEGQRALFVSPWIENIESPRQIYPALGLLNEMQGSAAERQILFNAASRAINRNFKDDRSFTYAWGPITARTVKVVAGEADPFKGDLKNSFRGMLLKNLTGTRCKDNEIKKDEPLPAYIEAANKLFGDKPLTFDDVMASELKGTVKIEHMLTKYPNLKKLWEEGVETKGMTIVDNRAVKHDQTDAEWISRVNGFMDKLLAYDGTDGESEAVLLSFKSSFLSAFVIDAVGPGELRKSMVRKYLRLLVGSPLQKTSFIEWLFWINMMERADPEDVAEIAEEFPNPNLKVLAAAKKLLEEPKKETAKPAQTPTPKP